VQIGDCSGQKCRSPIPIYLAGWINVLSCFPEFWSKLCSIARTRSPTDVGAMPIFAKVKFARCSSQDLRRALPLFAGSSSAIELIISRIRREDLGKIFWHVPVSPAISAGVTTQVRGKWGARQTTANLFAELIPPALMPIQQPAARPSCWTSALTFYCLELFSVMWDGKPDEWSRRRSSSAWRSTQ